MAQGPAELVAKLAAPNTLAPSAVAEGVASLHHESFYYAVEYYAVIVTISRVGLQSRPYEREVRSNHHGNTVMN